MARTIKELKVYCDQLDGKLGETRRDLDAANDEFESIWDKLERIQSEVAKLDKHSAVKSAIQDPRAERTTEELNRVRDELKTLEYRQREVTAENAVFRQRLDEQQKQIDRWESRVWAFVGALLMIAAGLIATLSGLRN